jgi:hypothetical protein
MHTALEITARSHHELAVVYDALLAQVRQMPSVEGILGSYPLEDLAPACRGGPVVVVNVHTSRCDALALCLLGHAIHVPLPQFSLQIAKSLRQLTIGTVLDNLWEREWAHFVCHGVQNTRSPMSSTFALHDGTLELSSLMGAAYVRGELAVSSACQIAKGSEELPEGAMHLAASMMVTGYMSVVAIL